MSTRKEMKKAYKEAAMQKLFPMPEQAPESPRQTGIFCPNCGAPDLDGVCRFCHTGEAKEVPKQEYDLNVAMAHMINKEK